MSGIPNNIRFNIRFQSNISLAYLYVTLRLCIKPGVQERGTECGELGE